MSRVATVEGLWHRFEARDWVGARALLRDDATMHWVASGEHFDDAEAMIRVQAIFPEGWSIRVIAVDELVNGDVHSIVEVIHEPARYFANSRFSFDADGLIQRVVEYWSTAEAPPDWRTAKAIGKYRRE